LKYAGPLGVRLIENDMCIDPKSNTIHPWTGIDLAISYKTLTWMTVQTPTRSLLAGSTSPFFTEFSSSVYSNNT
jgi:hypothetical protein